MYGYTYSYNNSIFGLAKYVPFIDYTWSVVGNELVNKGTSTNAEMFTGRALSFDSASSQSVDIDLITLTSDFTFCTNFVYKNEAYSTLVGKTDGNLYISLSNTNVLYIRGSIFENIGITLNTQLVLDNVYSLSIVKTNSQYLVYINSVLDSTYTFTTLRTLTFDSLGRYDATYKSPTLSNLVILNEALTPQQISDYYTTPHTFLYKTESGLASDSGLDTSKVVSWFPMTEDDGYVRDVANYSEGSELVANGTAWSNTDGTEVINGDEVTLYGNGSTDATKGQYYLRDTVGALLQDLEAGVQYQISFSYKCSGTNLTYPQLKDGNGVSLISVGGKQNTEFETFTVQVSFEAPTNAYIYAYDNGNESQTWIIHSVKQVSGIYPITNYTTDMPLKGLNYGLQTAKLLLDDNGVVVGKSDFAEFYGDGYIDTGWMPSADEDWSVECIFYAQNETDRENYLSVFGSREAADNSPNNFAFMAHKDYNHLWYLRIGDKTNGVNLNSFIDTRVLLSFTYIDSIVNVYINNNLIAEYPTTFNGCLASVILGAERIRAIIRNNYTEDIRLFKVHNKVLTQEEITNNYNDYVAQGLLND